VLPKTHTARSCEILSPGHHAAARLEWCRNPLTFGIAITDVVRKYLWSLMLPVSQATLIVEPPRIRRTTMRGFAGRPRVRIKNTGSRALFECIFSSTPPRRRSLGSRSWRSWRATATKGPGTLYPILHGLERQGLLRREAQVVNGKVRKYYRLTPAGQRRLRSAQAHLQELAAEVLPRTGATGKKRLHPGCPSPQ